MDVYLMYLESHFARANKKCLNVRMRFWFFSCVPTFRQKDEDEADKDPKSENQSKTRSNFRRRRRQNKQSKQQQTQQRIPTKIKVPSRKL